MLDLRDTSGRNVTPDEYLEKALSTFSEPGQAAGGDLKQRLRGFFSRQGCVTLVRPSGNQILVGTYADSEILWVCISKTKGLLICRY